VGISVFLERHARSLCAAGIEPAVMPDLSRHASLGYFLIENQIYKIAGPQKHNAVIASLKFGPISIIFSSRITWLNLCGRFRLNYFIESGYHIAV